jgi:hypothetical protein
MANEFVARKGLIISGSTTSFKIEDLPGSGTSNEVLVRESDGTIKTKTNASSSGSSGTSGNDGSPGSSGSSGTSGANGAPGSSGSSGTSGNDGSSGSSGTSGANGAPGSSGSSGTSGNDGSSGSSGTSGADGSLTLTGTTDNGVITLNGTAPNATVESNLIFDGSKLLVSGSGSTIFEVIGSEGQLFSITDSLSGSLFAVSDVSGFPILEVFSDDKIVGGTFNSNTFVVTGSQIGIGHDSPSTLLHISGSAPLRIEGLAAGSESLFLTVDSNGVVKTNTAGAAGSSGSSGSSGTSGNDGSPGSSGSSGTSGANGAPGSSGSSGTSGNDGSNGAPGSSGSSGTSGNDGSNGAPGSSGSSGTSGNDGSNGAPGSSGSSGTSGILPLTGTTTNGIITYDGDGTGTVESNLTFNGSTLSAPKLSLNSNNPLIVQTQAGDAITVNDDLGGNIVKLGDVDLSGNEVYVSIDDPDSQILLNTPLLNLKNNTPTIISGSSSAKFKLDTYAFGYNTFPGIGFDVTGSGIIVSSSLPSTHYPMVKIGETELIDLTTDTALSGHTFNIHNVDDFRVTSGSEPTELNTNVLFEHTGLGFNVYTKGQTTATFQIQSASILFNTPDLQLVPNNDLYVGSKNVSSTPQYVATWEIAPNGGTGAVLNYTTASVFGGGGGGSGSSGSSGTSGANGAPGSSGSSGTSGNDGSNGAPGSSGSSGTSGNDGSNGAPGSSGSSGTSGNDGSNGAPGSSGSSGTSGILPLTGTTTNGIITYDGDGTGTVESGFTYNGTTLNIQATEHNFDGGDIIIDNNTTLYRDGGLNTPGPITGSDVYIDDWGSVSASLAAAGGGGSSTLAGLSDVTLSGLADGDLLRYNGTATEWQNTNLGLSLTPTLSMDTSFYFPGNATISNYGSYTLPSVYAEVKLDGNVLVPNSSINHDGNGYLNWNDPSGSANTGSRVLEVQVQDFGDLASEIASASYTIDEATFRYYRFETTTASSNTYVRDFRVYTDSGQGGTSYPPNMTSDTTPSPYVASSNGYYNATYINWKAFDNSPTSTGWWNLGLSPYSGDWLQIDLGSNVTIKSARLIFNSSFKNFSVGTLYGSTTGDFTGEEEILAVFDNSSNTRNIG